MRISRNLMAIVCLIVLCITLSLGLWPFHSPRNDVAWMKPGGLSFGEYGTVISSGSLKSNELPNQRSGSIEVWVHPDRRNSATILSLYRPEDGLLVTLNQSITDLEISAEFRNDSVGETKWHFFAGGAFARAIRAKRPVLVATTFSPAGTKVYLDGSLVEVAAGLWVPNDTFESRVIVGDSPRQPNSFRGDIRGLAIYDAELNDQQVRQHYMTWTQHGHPGLDQDPRAIAIYLFNEGVGDLAHNLVGASANLEIPARYVVLDKIWLEPLWSEFSFSGGYWTGNLKNIVGFIPLGFCFYAYFAIAAWRDRATLATLAWGVSVSLAIELFQAVLPTRDSGTTDIVTNALGTYLGVLSYRSIYLPAAERLRWLAWFVPNSGHGTGV